jgi:hypothetical protein
VTLVLAGTYDQARFYAHQVNLPIREMVYISHPEKIMGIKRGTPIQCVGTYRERADFWEIHALSLLRSMPFIETQP